MLINSLAVANGSGFPGEFIDWSNHNNKLYISLLLFSITVPLLLSFDKKLQFYRQWRFLFPSLIAVAAFFILFDIFLTRAGVWDFNPRYHLNLVFLGLPLEEWLFFIIIPYASIFLHEAIVLYFPNLKLGKKWSGSLVLLLIVILSLLILFNFEKAYTIYVFCLLILTLVISLMDGTEIIRHFLVSFIAILFPFLIVNGILTGTLIEEEVVWYNNSEILGIRFLTIPVEDFGYAFSMILMNLQLISQLKKYSNRKKTAQIFIPK